MDDCNRLRAERITTQALHDFVRWTDRCSELVREKAHELALAGSDSEPVITSDTLRAAFRIASHQLSMEVDASAHEDDQHDQEGRRAA